MSETDWTDPASIAAAMGLAGNTPEPEAKPPVDEAVAAAEGEAAATEEAEPAEQAEASEQSRDKAGKWMPLDQHKATLERSRGETAAERQAREAAEAKVRDLLAQVADLSKPKPVDDKRFENAIAYLPEEEQAVMRQERAARIADAQRAADLEARLTGVQQERETERLQREHESALDAVPALKVAYGDPIKRAAIDAISDSLRSDKSYTFTTRADHYAQVEKRYLEAFPAPTPKRTLPPLKSTPASLSAVPGSSPTNTSEVEALVNAPGLSAVALLGSMKSEQEITDWMSRNFR